MKISALRKLLVVTSFGLFMQAWTQSLSDLEAKVLGDLQSEENTDTESAAADQKAEAEEEEVASPKSSKKSLDEVESLIWGPRSIPNEHILVVQRRFVDKAGRFELMPVHLGVQPSNSFSRQFIWGAGISYHLTESFGLELLHVSFASTDHGDLEKIINDATGLKIRHNDNSVLLMGGSVLWTPFKSKAATKREVYHFEGYFLAGGGSILAENSRDPMAMAGFGFRSYLNRDGIFKFELRDYIQFGGSTVHRLSLLLGAGILL